MPTTVAELCAAVLPGFRFSFRRAQVSIELIGKSIDPVRPLGVVDVIAKEVGEHHAAQLPAVASAHNGLLSPFQLSDPVDAIQRRAQDASVRQSLSAAPRHLPVP